MYNINQLAMQINQINAGKDTKTIVNDPNYEESIETFFKKNIFIDESKPLYQTDPEDFLGEQTVLELLIKGTNLQEMTWLHESLEQMSFMEQMDFLSEYQEQLNYLYRFLQNNPSNKVIFKPQD